LVDQYTNDLFDSKGVIAMADSRKLLTSPFKFEPIERKTFVAEITSRMLDYLLSGESPCDKLPAERHLSGALGIRRTPLQEDLKALTLLGYWTFAKRWKVSQRADSDLLPQVVEWGLRLVREAQWISSKRDKKSKSSSPG
jgi:DNA-binding FadR family transcriptional regulator